MMLLISNLAHNYLTGPLSPSVGNLVRMEWMIIGINAMSGEIPPEIGLLTELRSLGLGANIFNGSLPPELGNLRRLEQLYMDSSGLSGEIPSTFGNLQSLIIVLVIIGSKVNVVTSLDGSITLTRVIYVNRQVAESEPNKTRTIPRVDAQQQLQAVPTNFINRNFVITNNKSTCRYS